MPLNDVILIDHSKPDTKVLKWPPPDLPHSGTWERLAAILIEYRRWLNEQQAKTEQHLDRIGEISDAGLRQLLGTAYRASFMRDEGRAVTGRLYVRASKAPPPIATLEGRARFVALRIISRFFYDAAETLFQREQRTTIYRLPVGQVLVDEKTIGRMTSTLHPEDAALLIHEGVGQLSVAGAVLLGYDNTGQRILDPLGWRTREPGLMIEIVGPGHLRVVEGQGEYTLRADQLIQHSSVRYLEPVQDWLFALSETLVERCRVDGTLHEEFLTDLYLEQRSLRLSHFGVSETLSGLLDQAVRLGHGGAFVVIPNLADAPIETVKFRVEPCALGELIIRAWIARREADQSSGASVSEDASWKRPEVHDWRSKIGAIGSLSAMDGCVVFDRQLTLHGFGGSIAVARDGPEVRPCINLHTKEVIPRAEMITRFGERHRSAYFLCHEVPDSLAFVVSQDGDLRFFASDTTNVYFADGLRP